MKTCQEWLLGFNQGYDNITSHRAPGLNAYEISCFLTDAQEVIVMGLYNGSLGKPFEAEEDVSNFLAPLMRQAAMEEVVDNNLTKISESSHIFTLPSGSDEILFKTLEIASVESDCNTSSSVPAIIVPVTQDEYWRTIRNPFKTCNANRVLRMTYPSHSSTDEYGRLSVQKYTELISDRPISNYTVFYITRPEPIIVEDLKESETSDGLTINGKWQAQPCLLDDALHQAILSEAIRMAKAVWQS